MLVILTAMALAAEPPASERAAIFRAAGFKLSGGRWESCGDPGRAAYEPGKIGQFGDVNGDGRPEAVVTEGSSYCFGATGTGFTLVSRSAAGKWLKLHQSEGVATFLKTKANGWPELEVGGPGFCFPLLRWTGQAFATHRHAYAGKRCTP